MTSADKKRKAAEASLEFIEPGAILGVGTGSTVNVLIDLLPGIRNRIDRVVSSSKATTALLEERGFTVSTLNEVGDLDLYIDGADEATKRLNLIKGGGGALTREKVLAGAARRFVCIVDDSKLVGMLGTFPLPIEVLPMAQAFVSRKFVKMRANPVWRENFSHSGCARPGNLQPARNGGSPEPDPGDPHGRAFCPPPGGHTPYR
jgi:ribose 5-phosphate isomerase A